MAKLTICDVSAICCSIPISFSPALRARYWKARVLGSGLSKRILVMLVGLPSCITPDLATNEPVCHNPQTTFDSFMELGIFFILVSFVCWRNIKIKSPIAENTRVYPIGSCIGVRDCADAWITLGTPTPNNQAKVAQQTVSLKSDMSLFYHLKNETTIPIYSMKRFY